jgi:hypothetical protein
VDECALNVSIMAKFITTIKLQAAGETDYDRLYTELEKESFRENKIPPVKNVHHFGRREYKREGNITLQEVTAVVLKAAARTGKEYSFTIIRDKQVHH